MAPEPYGPARPSARRRARAGDRSRRDLRGLRASRPRRSRDGSVPRSRNARVRGDLMSSPIEGIAESLDRPFALKEGTTGRPSGAHARESIPSGEMDLRSGTKGPVTASRHRRNALVYGIACVLGILPTLLGMPAGWQAFGLGLFLPGAGFLAVGGWALLLFPLTLLVFWLSVVAWFWAGMVVAPLTVWIGSAALAGAMVADAIWPAAAFLAPL